MALPLPWPLRSVVRCRCPGVFVRAKSQYLTWASAHPCSAPACNGINHIRQPRLELVGTGLLVSRLQISMANFWQTLPRGYILGKFSYKPPVSGTKRRRKNTVLRTTTCRKKDGTKTWNASYSTMDSEPLGRPLQERLSHYISSASQDMARFDFDISVTHCQHRFAIVKDLSSSQERVVATDSISLAAAHASFVVPWPRYKVQGA